ncbi:SDR family oxidoreductase [soil metagenome]
MKILLIGGTGLISCAITRLLVERQDEVVLYNRGVSDQSDRQPPPGVPVILGDRMNYPAFEQQMAEAGHFDCVIDMVNYLPADAESAVRAFRGRVGHYIFCSTVDVYRKPATRYPYTEAETYGGLNAYSSNKVTCEQILWEAHHPTDFPLTIIRPAYTYGEGRGPVHTFGFKTTHLDRIRKGKPIVVHGDGSSLWVACHRDDVARAFVTAIGKPVTIGKAYHTTGEEWLTWDQYHQTIAATIGAPAPTLVHIPTDLLGQVAPKQAAIAVENFQFNNIFDNRAAHADLDFRYTIPWSAGIQRIVAWLDQHQRIENSDQDSFEDQLIAAWQRFGQTMATELHDVS